MALVAGGLGYTILPSSFQTIRFECLIWKPIEVDASWTETSLNLVCFKDTLLEPVAASFIACVRRHACTAKSTGDSAEPLPDGFTGRYR